MSDQSSPAGGFDRFGLHDALLRGIRDAGFTSPRPIQADTIPASLEGRDVLGLALAVTTGAPPVKTRYGVFRM